MVRGVFWAVMLAAIVFIPPAAEAQPDPRAVLAIEGDRFLMNGRPFKMWGVRTAGATQDQDQTDHLIAQLDDYKAHGINAVTVFYMGCSGANYDPFAPDGLSIDPGHQRRMEQIIRACDEREMAVIVGIFYQRAPFGLRDAQAVRDAVRTVPEGLKPFPNILINIANEQNSGGWRPAAPVFDFRDPERIIELCALVHATDPGRLVGGGGYDREKNKIIGGSRHVDALLFDFNNVEAAQADPLALYEAFVAGGVENKPVVNVEIFGGYTKDFERGVFSDTFKGWHYQQVDAAASRPGFYVFLHNSPWFQVEPMRYDLGGSGTPADPGVRWYFDHVKSKTGASTP